MGGLVQLLCIPLLVTLLLIDDLYGQEYLFMTLPQGVIMGKKVNIVTGGEYYSFQGIPYAKPPLGELRFKAPVEPEPWNEALEAVQEGSVCIQPEMIPRALKGSEDCLFLNVYMPQFPDADSLLPVMVWIHGGAFVKGSGNKLLQGPEYLLRHGIIYVSINYRLGVFGFLSTEDEAAPGNIGLKDQVMALRWIQKNIAEFGGDPDKVTIAGQSAGGASVQYHMISPMSEGLFHGAIAQSGAVLDGWAEALEPRENAFLLGNALGYSGNSSTELVNFLRNVTADELFATSLATYSETNSFRLLKAFYVPTVEPEIEGEEAFLTQSPLQLVQQGKFHNVPYLTGVTSAEGIYFISAGGIVENASRIEDINNNFLKTFKPELMVCREEECGDPMIDEIRSFYFGDEQLNDSTLDKFIDMGTDMNFAEGVIYGVKRMSSQITAPVYLYEFTYEGGLAYFKTYTAGLANYTGVCHADDLGYIFDIGVATPVNSTDDIVRSRMTKMWTDFVKTGNPTPEATDDIPVWLPYTNSSAYYLDIGEDFIVKEDISSERIQFWQDLYQSYL